MIPENDAPLIRVGADADLKLRSMPGRKFTGKVTRFANTLDKRTQTMLVEIVLKNTHDGNQWVLLAGMYGEATITLQQKPKTLVLPASAIRFDSNGKGSIYTLGADDTVRITPVTTGLDFGDEIEVVSGVKPGDRIVGATIGRLKSGQKVRVKQ